MNVQDELNLWVKGLVEDDKHGDVRMFKNGKLIRGFWTYGFYVEDQQGESFITKPLVYRNIRGDGMLQQVPITLPVIKETVRSYAP